MAAVQSPKQFLADFISHARHAQKRIYLQSMIFENGKVLAEIEPILIQKAQENVDVHIITDWVAPRYAKGDIIMIKPLFGKTKSIIQNFQKEIALVQTRLVQAGAKFTVTNRFNPLSPIFPILKRNHRKIYIVDDMVWIGGVNFYDAGFEMIDFLVKFSDPQFTESIAKEFHQINKKRPASDHSIHYNDDYTILLDSGGIGKSIIYDTAVSLVNQARKSVFFVSQFIPDGRLLDALIQAAARGIDITIITDYLQDKAFTTFPYNLPYMHFKAKIKQSHAIKLFHNKHQIHSKLLLVDGKAALFGSHNLVNIGVLLGTEEIAIKTTDTQLVKDLEKYREANTTPTSA